MSQLTCSPAARDERKGKKKPSAGCMAKPITVSATHLDPGGRTSSSMRSPFLGSSLGFQPQNPGSEGLLTEEPSCSSRWICLPSHHTSCSCISPNSSAGKMTLHPQTIPDHIPWAKHSLERMCPFGSLLRCNGPARALRQPSPASLLCFHSAQMQVAENLCKRAQPTHVPPGRTRATHFSRALPAGCAFPSMALGLSRCSAFLTPLISFLLEQSVIKSSLFNRHSQMWGPSSLVIAEKKRQNKAICIW